MTNIFIQAGNALKVWAESFMEACRKFWRKVWNTKAEGHYKVDQVPHPGRPIGQPNCRHQVSPYDSAKHEQSAAAMHDRFDRMDKAAETEKATHIAVVTEETRAPEKAAQTDLPPGVYDMINGWKANPEEIGKMFAEAHAALQEEPKGETLADVFKAEKDETQGAPAVIPYDEGLEAEVEGKLQLARQALQYTKHTVKRKKLESQVLNYETQLTALREKNNI